jgi:hypothetical protein
MSGNVCQAKIFYVKISFVFFQIWIGNVENKRNIPNCIKFEWKSRTFLHHSDILVVMFVCRLKIEIREIVIDLISISFFFHKTTICADKWKKSEGLRHCAAWYNHSKLTRDSSCNSFLQSSLTRKNHNW